MLLDRKTNLIHIPYEYDENEGGYIDYVEPFPLGTGLSSKVITSGQPLLAGSLDEEIANGAYFPPEIIAKGSGFYSQSWLGVPIMVKDQALGLIALSDAHPHAFNESHLRLMQTLSSNVGVAIENARLFQEEQQRVAELAIINSVQAALAAELNIQGIYDAVGDKIREIFHNADISIRIYDPSTNLLCFPYWYENGERISIEPMIREEKGFSAHVLRTRETLVINENFEQAMEKYGSHFLPGTQVKKSAVYVPLVAGEQARGLITLSNIEREHAFSDSDVRLLQTLANSMSVALENARLFGETQRLLVETEQRAAELAVINSIQEGLASKLDMQSICELIGEKSREVFYVQVVDIVLYDEASNLMTMPYSFENGDRSVIPPQKPFGFRLKVIESGAPLLINKNFKELAIENNNPVLTGGWPKSVLFVPILVENKVKGVISIQDLERENAFSDSEVNLLQTLANSMSVALENARLFDETQRLLKETDQRAKELAVINSIQQGLAAQLDMQSIYDLVGDKIHEIFDAQVVFIATGDLKTGIGYANYLIEKGQRFYPEPTPYGKLARHMIETRQPVLIRNKDEFDQYEVDHPGDKIIKIRSLCSHLL